MLISAINYTSRAQVQLPAPARILQRMCKHFSHKVEAKWNQAEGFVDFVVGSCAIYAQQHCLILECDAANPDDLRDIEETLERHLAHLAAPQTEAVNWMR